MQAGPLWLRVRRLECEPADDVAKDLAQLEQCK